jgi:hypothetical protein
MKRSEYMRDFSDFREKVIGWIAEWRRVPRDRLTSDTKLNYDLGIDGDDAQELLQHLANKSGVSFAKFQYVRFFGPEGMPWRDLIDLITRKRRWRLEPLTAATLIQYMWDHLPAQHVLKILPDPSGKRRLLIVRRSDGLFGYEEEELQSKYDDELGKRLGDRSTIWVQCTQLPFTICDSPEAAEREARGNVKWLSQRSDAGNGDRGEFHRKPEAG